MKTPPPWGTICGTGGWFMRRFHRIAIVLFLFTSLTRLGAQTTTGSIVGTVSDPSGAVIAGANITVTNIDTAIAVKTTTDATGNYAVPPLSVALCPVGLEASACI